MMAESATVEPSAVRSLPLDVAKIRSDFPIFHNRLAYEPFYYLDSAATSQTPRQVVEAVAEYYSDYNATFTEPFMLLVKRPRKRTNRQEIECLVL